MAETLITIKILFVYRIHQHYK